MNRRQFIATTGATVACVQARAAAKAGYQSSSERTAVLELFTSEGCSSCPPAEEWFSKLKEAPGLWTQFIPMAFHVDYWDYLGWKDSYASASFTERQHAYASLWQAKSVYTPEFVMNGREWRENRLVLPERGLAGVLTMSSGTHSDWNLHFEPVKGGLNGLVYHAALLGSETSKVTAGENSGRILKHDFTVLSHASIAANDGQASLKLSAGAHCKAVVGWVSRGADPAPLQAVGGWL